MNLAYWQMHGMDGGSWSPMALAAVIVWGLVIAAVVWFARSRDRPAPPATEILDRRLAAGDISVDEHQRLREVLRASARPPHRLP